jgi:SprT protein
MAETEKPVVALDDARQSEVIAATAHWIENARQLYRRDFSLIPVSFDLRGRSAGMYRVTGRRRVIRYNPFLFAKYFANNLAVTVPHEVAHYVTDMLFGIRRVRPHGAEWQAVMRAFNADASRTADYDLSGIPVRMQRRFGYRCACLVHQLSTRRHNQVCRGAMRYFCRLCGEELRYEQGASIAAVEV